MTDPNRFEQVVADEVRRAVGPEQAVDDAAVLTAAQAQAPERPWTAVTRWLSHDEPSTAHRRGFSMFSAVKLVAAAAILALTGGFLVSGVLTTPEAEPLPAAEASAEPTEELEPTSWVTGVASGHSVISSGGRRWADGRTTYPEEVWEAKLQSEDPRITGTLMTTMNLHELGEGDARVGGAVAGGALTAGIMRLETENGAWVGPFTGLREPKTPWYHRTQALLVGEGDYAGLQALLLSNGTIGEGYEISGTQRVDGFIFEGEMPQPPEVAE